MGIFSRFSDIVNSNLNAILEKAEDPEKIVRLMIQEMEDTLVEVRSAAARSIADKKELNRKLAAIEKEAGEWEAKAELAVRKGRDDLAKAALAEKAHVDQSTETLKTQYTQIDDGLSQLNEDIARLEEKLADAKSRQKALLMRHHTASRRLEVRKQLHENKIDDALMRFEAFERKMEDVESRVEAYDLGMKKDLSSQFTNLESEESVEQELAELKARISGDDSRKQDKHNQDTHKAES
ncbi:MAG: phage shock protein PspA [Gammaproteobacteria bacterium]|nr:phage shock protein PspA [Gammaproteobacteria bacterium]